MGTRKKQASLNQSALKIKSYFESFIRKEEILEKILLLRKEINIPRKGFPLKKNALEEIKEFSIFYFPVKLPIEERKVLFRKINKGIKEIAKAFDFQNSNLLFLLKIFLYHNRVPEQLFERLNTNGNCAVRNQRSDFLEISEDKYLRYLEKETQNYPVSINLTSFASQRNILDFVKRNWAIIEYFQKENLPKTSTLKRIKRRKPSIQKRDDFIYKNKHLPLKEIRALLAKKKLFLDDGLISKIISLEKKRRKKV